VPELPDVDVYAERLTALYGGQALGQLRIKSAFLLRSAAVPATALAGKRLLGVTRLGKRLVWAFDGSLFAVLHLMIAGRLHRKPVGAPLASKQSLAAWDFPGASILLTEAGSKRRASLYLVDDERDLEQFDRGGLEPLSCTASDLPTDTPADKKIKNGRGPRLALGDVEHGPTG
jgi:formamidopyrimidine-DNA glycosylase